MNAGFYSTGPRAIFGILYQMKEDLKKKLDMYLEEYYMNKKLLIDAYQLLELARNQRSS